MAYKRKYTDETLDMVEKLRSKGVAWLTIHAKLPGASAALRMRNLRKEKPKVITTDVLYPASYYKKNNLPSPYDD